MQIDCSTIRVLVIVLSGLVGHLITGRPVVATLVGLVLSEIVGRLCERRVARRSERDAARSDEGRASDGE
jgi:hypothetical protein